MKPTRLWLPVLVSSLFLSAFLPWTPPAVEVALTPAGETLWSGTLNDTDKPKVIFRKEKDKPKPTIQFKDTTKDDKDGDQKEDPPKDQVNGDASQKEAENLDREGPASITFDVLKQIDRDYTFRSESEIINIYNNSLYRDANIKSGYFYYIPGEYTLNWSDSDPYNYGFYYNYLQADAQGGGAVVVTAELKPNIDRKDLEIAKLLLKKDLKGKEEDKYALRDILSVPLTTPPRISFSSIRLFGVDPEDIELRATSDFLNPIVLTWRMDRVDDLMNAMFEDIGLVGKLLITLSGDGSEIEIPISMKLDQHTTFGRFELTPGVWRTQNWKNPTPYPVVLNNLHVLREEMVNGETQVKVYTWDLGKKVIPENASAKFKNPTAVPAFLDTDAKVHRMWVEYTVQSCFSCNKNVQQHLMGSTDEMASSMNLEVIIFDVMSYTGAELMVLKMRSLQADPNRISKKQLKTLTISSDGETLSGGNLFVKTNEKPDFEFQLTLVMPDGERHSSEWVKGDEIPLILTQKDIKELIGNF